MSPGTTWCPRDAGLFIWVAAAYLGLVVGGRARLARPTPAPRKGTTRP